MVPFGKPSDNGQGTRLSTAPVSRPCPACFKVLRVAAPVFWVLHTKTVHKKATIDGRFSQFFLGSESRLAFLALANLVALNRLKPIRTDLQPLGHRRCTW